MPKTKKTHQEMYCQVGSSPPFLKRVYAPTGTKSKRMTVMKFGVMKAGSLIEA
jgi:hypothetical protein